MRSKQKEQRAGNKKPGDSLLNRKIIAPQKLKILVLAGNDLSSQHLDFLGKCVNLIKIDISHNHIVKLSPSLDLSALLSLEVVFLHHNKLSSVEAIHPLYKCEALTFLTYHHNPLESTLRHQHEIINYLPNLKLINNRIVFLEERADFLLPQRLPVLADMDMLENWKSVQNSETYYLKVLNMQLQYIDNLWAFNNPIVIIQRAWKHFLPESPSPLPSSQAAVSRHSKIDRKAVSRNRASSKMQSLSTPHPLREWFVQWKTFSESLKFVRWSMKNCLEKDCRVDKSYMLFSLQQYEQELRNMRVNKPLIEFITKIRRRIYERKMGKRLMANIKLKQTLFQHELSFYNISGIQEHGRFYYNKTQQHILDNFLQLIAENFNKREAIYNQSNSGVAKHFNAIRLVDPESFSNKYHGSNLNSLCSLVWPSMKVVVSNRKAIASQFKAGIIGIPQLTYIRNRDKVLTGIEFQKSKDTYRRLQKFAFNEYETSLYFFECKDEFVMRHLTRMFYYHNSKAVNFEVKQKRNQMMSLLQNFQEPFIFYVDNVLKRTAAAVTIQKSWRRYISNKNQAESIYRKMKKNRAALHIQRFFRDSIYTNRLHFHKKLARDLGQLKTTTIIYPLSFYMNLNQIFKPPYQSSLFQRVRITRSGHTIGLAEEFFKPIFQEKIRDTYFKGQRLGTENHPTQIDLFNLLHYKVAVNLLLRNGVYFISFTYSSEAEANIAASIIALLSYQLWGGLYVWPLTRQNLGQWQWRINEYLKIKEVRPFIGKFRQQSSGLIPLQRNEVKEHGLFVWSAQARSCVHIDEPKMALQKVNVQFYLKRYHNFPVKQTVSLNYTVFNEKLESDKQENVLSESEASEPQLDPLRLQAPSQEGPLNITTIDKRRFSLFDQSEKTLRQPEPDAIATMGNTQNVSQQGKKDKVMKFYQEEYLKKQAQKQYKETTLVGVREKARKQKVMNSTLRSLKEAERTEALRSKVQKIKDYKQRSVQKRDEEEFVQQNNFVMKQQLKMMIMRNKMKEAEGKKEDFLTKKSSLQRNSDIFAPSIPSRKSSRQKQRARMEEVPMGDINKEQTIGEEGSVVNTKKRIKKTRAHSIGAYMRDPSFVHGVFPEEYYPIESRATSFYFPPVV